MNIRHIMARTGSLPSTYSIVSLKSAAISQNSLICLRVNQTAGLCHFPFALFPVMPYCRRSLLPLLARVSV